MKEILIGTHNRHKKEEISLLLKDLPMTFKDLSDFPNVKIVDEDGKTLLANAIKKAKVYSELTGFSTIADDTGLEVDALNGAPGVYSARYAGETCSYKDNNEKIIKELSLQKNGNRKATFKCVIAYSNINTNTIETVEGAIEGSILTSMKGENGFGYDSIFYVDSHKKTFAELTLEEKNKLSHRSIAVQKMKEILKKDA